ncbi:MAG: hypothetical protein NTX65_12400 [Ignavibacteriales bacterium]|nr:hypothetical protein [Ignavibacteriales bacterium]
MLKSSKKPSGAPLSNPDYALSGNNNSEGVNSSSSLQYLGFSNSSSSIEDDLQIIRNRKKRIYLRFTNYPNDQKLIEIYPDPNKAPIVTEPSIYWTYFSYLFTNQDKYSLSDYAKKSGLSKFDTFKKGVAVEPFRTAATRLYNLVKGTQHNEAKEIAESIRRSIVISSRGKQKLIEFIHLPFIQFEVF